MKTSLIATDPIFNLGRVPYIPHCEIQQREFRDREWHYFIQNNYSPIASGWITEDRLMEQISDNKRK